MAEQLDMVRARRVYNTVIAALDEMEWTYDRDDENLTISTGVKSNDIDIKFTLKVRAQQDVLQFKSKLPFNMAEDKRVDGAIVVGVANYGMINGSFDYDISDGEIAWRLTTSYRASDISTEMVKYIINVSVSSIDDYNDKFFAVSKGYMTVESFIEGEKS